MFTFNIPKLTSWFLRFLQLQLFVWLIALPILLCWGLPLSLLAPVGNLLFSPFLAVFLLLSSLIFFSELLYIPNGALYWCLERVTTIWLYLTNLPSNWWLIGFTQPPFWVLVAIPLVALALLHARYLTSITYTFLSFSALFFIACTWLYYAYTPSSCITAIPCNNGHVTVIYCKKQLSVIDPGVIGQRLSASSFVEYTLMPETVKATGRTIIDRLILLQPGGLLFEAVTKLIEKQQVREICLPWWQGRLKKNAWRQFMIMRRVAEKYGVKLKRVFDKPIDCNGITITPLEKKLAYHEATFPAMHVTGSVGEQVFEVYSHKYKNRPH